MKGANQHSEYFSYWSLNTFCLQYFISTVFLFFVYFDCRTFTVFCVSVCVYACVCMLQCRKCITSCTWDSLSWTQTPGTWGTALSPRDLWELHWCQKPTALPSAGLAPYWRTTISFTDEVCVQQNISAELCKYLNICIASSLQTCTHLASSSHSVVSSEIQGLDGSEGVRKGSYSTYCSV